MTNILGVPNYYVKAYLNFRVLGLPNMETWNLRLKVARENNGLRPTDLAKEVGVSNATVSDWESGEIKKLEGENLLKVCNLLNISPNWLMFGKGEMAQQHLTDDDLHALKINRMLGSKERRAWYRAGDSLAEPDEGTNGKQ